MRPGRDGPSIVRALGKSGNSVPILLLTARSAVIERIEGLETGTDDYLFPDSAFTPRKLLRYSRSTSWLCVTGVPPVHPYLVPL
jgi:two-component system, OmpR family, phosphate regulon response regulator OmpR